MRSGTGSASRRRARAESLRRRIVETVKIQEIVREIRNNGTIQTGCQQPNVSESKNLYFMSILKIHPENAILK